MKQILITLLLVALHCNFAMSQTPTIIKKDITNKTTVTVRKDNDGKNTTTTTTTTYTPTYTDTYEDGTTVDGVTVESTMSGDSIDTDDYIYSSNPFSTTLGWDEDTFKDIGIMAKTGATIVFTAIILFFLLPIIIIFLAFYFHNRNRRERYRLLEQSLATGKPLPDSIVRETMKLDTESKGIKNMCLGIGLFFFFWLLLHSIGIASIGILVFFSGLGQYLVARKNRPSKDSEQDYRDYPHHSEDQE